MELTVTVRRCLKQPRTHFGSLRIHRPLAPTIGCPPRQLSFSSFSRGDRFFSWRERCRGNNYLLAVGRTDCAVIRCGSMGTNYGEPSDGWSNQRGLARLPPGDPRTAEVSLKLQTAASFEISSNLVSLCYGEEASIKWRADCVLILRRDRSSEGESSNNRKSPYLFFYSQNLSLKDFQTCISQKPLDKKIIHFHSERECVSEKKNNVKPGNGLIKAT